jgi:hypothetical protein
MIIISLKGNAQKYYVLKTNLLFTERFITNKQEIKLFILESINLWGVFIFNCARIYYIIQYKNYEKWLFHHQRN